MRRRHYGRRRQFRGRDGGRQNPHRRPKRFLNKYWKSVVYSFVISIAIGVIAIYLDNTFLKVINIFSWFVLSFFLYKQIFFLVNRIDLSNDLNFVIMKIIGVAFAFTGLFIGGTFFLGGVIMNLHPITMGVGILILCFGFLGLFMVFRTKRRFNHLYVNR